MIFSDMEFKYECKRQMKRRWVSYRIMSEECGIPHATLHRVVNCASNAKMKHVLVVCDALGINLTLFIRNEGER